MDRKKILIADDDSALTKALTIRCKEFDVSVKTSPDGLHAYQSMLKDRPDLLILDLNMPGAGGLYMCEELAQDERFANIPIIILTGESNDETIERCERLGVCYAWKGLETWETLRPMIRELLKLDEQAGAADEAAAEAPVGEAVAEDAPPADDGKPCVLIIDDDLDLCKAMTIRLKANGCRVATAHSGKEGYWLALKVSPDVIITDFNMPDGCGNHVIGKIHDHPLTKDTPVIVLTGQTIGGQKNYPLERELISLGAARFFTKPPDFDAILEEIKTCVSGVAF